MRCVGDCAKLSMIFLLKCTLFGIIPIMSLFLTLALPILSAVPSDRVAILGVVGLSVYNTIFLTVFGELCQKSVLSLNSDQTPRDCSMSFVLLDGILIPVPSKIPKAAWALATFVSPAL